MNLTAITNENFRFQVLGTDGSARCGVLHTAHGAIDTPAFMPVGTAATVKAMTADAVRATGAQCLLSNTYHLMLRPGADRLARLGGLRRFMDWSGPVLTDSGGFQIMSLAGLRNVDQGGVTFRSHIDGTRHRLTPSICMDLQDKFDSTISMVLDECIAFPAGFEDSASSVATSIAWASLSKAAFRPRPGYGLFGIVQGSTYPDLRVRAARILREIGFDGYAVGGLAVGEGQKAMLETLAVTVPHLPDDAPRYLMGVGTPDDILGAVERGIDMFDCVIPTRAGRTARAYTASGVVNLRNARFADDPGPLDPDCDCRCCVKASRAYLHHLFRAGEMLGPMLLTLHNLTYYQALMSRIRASIKAGQLPRLTADLRAGWRMTETI